MSPPVTAGLLVWRRRPDGPKVLLAHPGGPYWRGKDEAGWSIPKGLVEGDEDPLMAARREFAEELGLTVDGDFAPLSPRRLPGGKRLLCWLIEAELDVSQIESNSFEIEWPPRSGRRQAFPEVDRAEWFGMATAAWKIHRGQQPVLAEAAERIAEVLQAEDGSSRS